MIETGPMSANNERGDYVKQLRSRSLERVRKDDPQSAEALEVRYGLNDETDRGCALMAAAYIEARLETLLKAYFVDNAQVTRKVLNGPVGSISSRTRMAYLLGLISFDLHEAILLISKIRNRFAHNHQALNFEHPLIKNLCGKLFISSYVSSDVSRRRVFLMSFMIVYGNLNSKIKETGHRQSIKENLGRKKKKG